MPMNEEPKWYILHTYSGYEAMVKDSLEKLIENNNLGDYIVDLKIPMEQVIEEKNGKRKVVERKRLPCYVFIKMIYTNQIWYYVTSTRGVTGFCGPQGRPIPMKPDEIRKMRLETPTFAENAFAVGDTVSVYIKSILPERLKIKLVALRKLDADTLPQRPMHYFRTCGHLDHWRYGSDSFAKTITVF